MLANTDHTELLKAMNIPEHAADQPWLTGSSSLGRDPAVIYEERDTRAAEYAEVYGDCKHDKLAQLYR